MTSEERSLYAAVGVIGTQVRGRRPNAIVARSTLLRHPASVAEAVSAMAECPHFTLCAGGTALMARANQDPTASPAGWIFLHDIAELHGCERLGDGSWRLGSLITLDRLASLHDVAVLAKAAAHAGSWQLRNAATLGGNLVGAWSTSDLIPVLLCLDAEVELVSSAGVRRQKIEDFLLGVERTTLGPGEILTAVVVAQPAGRQCYERVSGRAAMSPLLCALAVCANGAEEAARVVVSDGAGIARRVPEAERVMWSGDSANDVVAATRQAIAPLDDSLASAAYRYHAIGVLARRAFLDITRESADALR